MKVFCSFWIWKLVATNVTESGDQVSRDIARPIIRFVLGICLILYLSSQMCKSNRETVTQSCDQVSQDIAWLESGKEEEKEKAGLTFNDLNIIATIITLIAGTNR